MRVAYLLGDMAAIVAAGGIVSVAVDLVSGAALGWPSLLEAKMFGVLSLALLGVAVFRGTYAAIPPRPVRLFPVWVRGAVAVSASHIAALGLFHIGTMTHYVALALITCTAIIFASFNRAMCRVLFGHSSWWGTRVIVVGQGSSTQEKFASIEREPQWGIRPVGMVEDRAAADDISDPSGVRDLLQRIDLAADYTAARIALLDAQTLDEQCLCDLLSQSGGRISHWIVMPSLVRFPSIWLEPCEVDRRTAFAVTNRLGLLRPLVTKRMLDLVVTSLAGLLVLPLIVTIAALIRFSSPGPVLYSQERIGRYGRRFKAWKFRTMHMHADAILERYLATSPELAAEWRSHHKLKRDPRVTAVGRFLRPISLDELPQLWNVLKGEMSLVGPRPIVAGEIDKYADCYEQYVKVRPGITGLWQVSGRNDTTYAERVDLDAYYVRNWSVWFDLYILACTVKVVLLGEGAY
jgi:Undecaprenyl-phosphate galactose phosphotransferase WbaP